MADPVPAVVPRAIVAGHGSFPDGIVSAVAQITGRGDQLLAFSNNGLCREEIESGLRAQLVQFDIHVVFTDLPGGSATIATRRVMRDDPSIVLVTGTNLATLIDFVFQDLSDAATAARRAVEKGRTALVAIGGNAPGDVQG